MQEANRVLFDFLPRFNERFRVPAAQEDVAYRPLDPDIRLDRIFCYRHWRRVARDNTVKYRWRTLQLLPDAIPGSYAGSKVEVLEGLDGTLRVQHEERIVSSQEAPPRPSVLRGFTKRTTHSPIINQPTNGLSRKWAAKLATLDTNHDAEHPIATSGRDGATQETHPATDGQVESGAEGEAQGTVHAWDRPGAGYTQRYREKVHERREPTYVAISTDVDQIVVW